MRAAVDEDRRISVSCTLELSSTTALRVGVAAKTDAGKTSVECVTCEKTIEVAGGGGGHCGAH